MKDLSFFFLKKYFMASRMRGRGPHGGLASSCGGDDSTSTLNQHQKVDVEPSITPENTPFRGGSSPRTLEEMILQLEVEEDIARKARLRESYHGTYDNRDDDNDTLYQPVRMSCVNSSDILRSARNALNHYPRFSLDGKDAMYRSSFQCQLDASADVTRQGGRRSNCREGRRSSQMSVERKRLPRTVAGESVVWCETGIVAKLMGLEIIPVPVKGKRGKDKLGTLLKRERRLSRRDRMLDINCRNGLTTEASCSSNTMRPIRAVGSPSRVGGWPTLRFP